MRREARFACAFAVSFALATPTAQVVHAAPAPADASPQQMEEAKRRYAEGHAKYLAGRYDEALAILLQSNALVPSPNSGLLIARCLLELNRPVEAYEKFTEVEQAALDLVREGETRYGETAAAAAKEKNVARAKISILRLSSRVGVTAAIDGKPVVLSVAGDGMAMHEPGAAKIVFKKDGYEDVHAVVLEPGKETLVAFRPPSDGPTPSTSPSPSPSPPEPSPRTETRGLPWYGYVTGGVALVGLGAFVGFGLGSESTYSDLESRCAPRCTAADRDEADSGRRMQTIANIGLVVGLASAIATTVIILSR